MHELFFWHTVEELEHRSVVLDMLKVISPSLFMRSLGLIIAYTLLVSQIYIGACLYSSKPEK